MSAHTEHASCGRTTDRRKFLADAGLIAVGLLSQFGVPTAAHAQPLPLLTPESVGAGGVSYPMPEADGAWADAGNKLLLVRANNAVYAFSLECPHRGAVLQWLDGETKVYCPKHKARFLPDGTRDSGRQTRSLDRLPITQTGNRVVVDTATRLRADVDASAYAAAFLKLK